MLTKNEMQKMAGMEGVVSVFLSEKNILHTTRSWSFMNFPVNAARSTTESNIIVGMIDTGIWPESPSFNDKGFGPPPSKWRGSCRGLSNFTCNNKIIGARYYNIGGKMHRGEVASPRDTKGHGTHTASIVAGQVVREASLLGLGLGTARGGVPSARIAVYKVCWHDDCSDANILAAFDDAIADGVDIISISVGRWSLSDYFSDPVAIGSFHAMKHGILTSTSVGNLGPSPKSILNCSPWFLSVAASTIDRKFVTKLKLGNRAVYEGISINTFSPKRPWYPIIHARDALKRSADPDSSYCSPNILNRTLVAGKIVVCDGGFDEENAVSYGAYGLVSVKPRSNVADSYSTPVSLINFTDLIQVLNNVDSTRKPTANILKSVEYKDELAPYVAYFSSRGPNPLTPDILKPDLTAPGVEILAAWSKGTSVTGYIGDTRVVEYNIASGTSMSCPHASATAAYVKSFHPTWSPAAIKSALMTTALPMSPVANSDAEFSYGSGHINPVKASDPGLVYDIEEIDYVKLLCGQGYNSTHLRLVTGDNTACSGKINSTMWDVNYPSFAVSISPGETAVTRVFHRTVTNVGSPHSTYKAVTRSPSGLKIKVEPDVLSFQFLGEKKPFTVTVEVHGSAKSPIQSGYLAWDDDVHFVRSPVVGFLYDPKTQI